MQTRLKLADNFLESEGVVIPFDPEIITPAISEAINSGYFEAEEAAQIPHIVRADDIVLDIGAGIGFISTLVSRHARRVISVEANPALMPFMEKLHMANGVENAMRLNTVLGAETGGTAVFYQRADFWMGSLSSGPNPYLSTVNVPVTGFDALLKKTGTTLIVCDIEGAESFLFHDANLHKVDRIYLELHDHITGLRGIAALFDDLAERGFAYDPRHSSGAIVLFQKVQENEVLRPYARAV